MSLVKLEVQHIINCNNYIQNMLRLTKLEVQYIVNYIIYKM